MAAKVAKFKTTNINEIPRTAGVVRYAFNSQKTKPLTYRLTQLRKLYWSIVDNTSLIFEAMKLDLGKSEYEVSMGELEWCKNDVIFTTKHLAKWMKDEKAADIPWINVALSPKIRKDPLGAVLIIGTYNFPLLLSIVPLIGAISAGCTAVLKPSENAPAMAMVLKKIVEDALDADAYKVVNGAIPETTALLDEKWDKIFYTGNYTVAKIISKKAAETLTPVCLELGGRNPAIVTKNADVRLAARRLLWGKTHNAGQVCISQNYTLIDKELFPAFIEELKKAWAEFFPNGVKASPDYGRIVNNKQFLRLKKMIDDSKGKILIGGEMDEATNFIEPTVVKVDDINDSLIRDESFGPLMPVYEVENLDQAIRIANSVDSTPLAVYPFGNKSDASKVLDQVASGGASINDVIFHGVILTLPFGGVGSSGTGSYHGRASFDCFVHRRSVISTPGWIEKLLAIRYPPYFGKLKSLTATSAKPDFDRNGNLVKGFGYWIKLLLGLGGDDGKSSLVRWVVLLVAAVATNKFVEGRGGLPKYLR